MRRTLPDIRAAQSLAKARGLDGAVVIGFLDGAVSVASYGATKAQCKELGALVDFISEAIEREEVPLGSLDTGGCDGLAFIEQGSET
jgi:hypothetical protein